MKTAFEERVLLSRYPNQQQLQVRLHEIFA